MISKQVKPGEWLNALANQSKFRMDFIRSKYWPGNPGFNLGPLALKNHLLIYVEKGSFKLVLEGKEEILPANSLLWLSPYVVRKMWTPANSKVINYRIHFNLFENEKLLVPESPYYIIKKCSELKPFFQRLTQLGRSQKAYSPYSIRATLTDLFATLFNIQSDLAKDNDNAGLNDFQRRQLQLFLNKNLSHPIKPIDLAHAVELSPDYFTRLFTKTYGISPRSFIKEERLRYASHMLIDTNLKINEIAHACGCDNIPLFTRQFREMFKCTPTQFRRTQFK